MTEKEIKLNKYQTKFGYNLAKGATTYIAYLAFWVMVGVSAYGYIRSYIDIHVFFTDK